MARTRRRGPPPQTIHVNITLEDKELLEEKKQHPDEPLYETFHRVITLEEFDETVIRIRENFHRIEKHYQNLNEDLTKILAEFQKQGHKLDSIFIESLSQDGRDNVKYFYKQKG